MGLLSSLVSTVKSSVVGKALDTLSAAFIKPVETVQAIFSPTKTINDVIKSVDSQSLTKNIVSTVVNTATAAAVVSGIGAVVSKGITPVVTSLIPATTKGKVIATVAAPLVVGAVINQPAKTINAVISAPSNLANFGGNVANLVATPSLSGAVTIVKENPLISAALGTAAAVTVGKAASTIVGGILTREEMQKQTEAFERQATAAELSNSSPQDVVLLPTTKQDSILATSAEKPITPQTETIMAGSTSKKRRKTSRIKNKVNSNITQRVSVIVANNQITKRYLNKAVLVH